MTTEEINAIVKRLFCDYERPTPMTLIEQLDSMVKRPGMYWGNSDNHFHSLVAFFNGYQIARLQEPEPRVERLLDRAIPEDFHQFVTEHFGHKYPHGGCGWMTFIEENTSSDREALELFLDLRKLYDEKESATKG